MKKIATILIYFCAIPCYAQWRDVGLGRPEGSFNNGLHIRTFAVHNTSLFACWYYPEGAKERLYRYTSPNTWTLADNGIDFKQGIPLSFASLGEFFFTTPGNSQIVFSTDNGSNWNNKVLAGGPVGTNGTYLFGAYSSKIARSKDTGKTWEHQDRPAPSGYVGNGSCIFAPTPNGVWRSLDSGSTWNTITTPTTTINNFAFIGSIVFGTDGTTGSVIKSTDSGSTWTQIKVSDYSVSSLASSGPYLFAGTGDQLFLRGGGIFISIDSGAHWRDVSDNLGENTQFDSWRNVTALQVFDTMLFASIWASSTLGDGVARPISEMVQEAKSSVRPIPIVSLDTLMVYPNPLTGRVTVAVGGTTTIEQVSVLNVLGVALLNEAGNHQSQVNLDLSKLPQGTYFLQVQTSDRTVVRKIVKE